MPASGCATVKPPHLPCRRARRSCCSEECICPRQTAAGHCFSMTQTSGNTPVPSCFAVWRFPSTFRMCRQALGHFLFAFLLLLCFLQASVPSAPVHSVLSAPAEQPSAVQSRPMPGKCSLQPDSQQAAGRNSIASQKTVRHLQNTPVCTHLPPLRGQVGNKDPTQPD